MTTSRTSNVAHEGGDTSPRGLCAGRACRPGFTLIELLLVLAIIGILTAVTVPSLVKSIRGNRMRTAARAVVSAGRYARSMAVLNQKNVDLVMDLSAGEIRAEPDVRRKLDGVKIASVAIAGPDGEVVKTDGECRIPYASHGRCTPYSVRLVDDDGAETVVHVDALASAETE